MCLESPPHRKQSRRAHFHWPILGIWFEPMKTDWGLQLQSGPDWRCNDNKLTWFLIDTFDSVSSRSLGNAKQKKRTKKSILERTRVSFTCWILITRQAAHFNQGNNPHLSSKRTQGQNNFHFECGTRSAFGFSFSCARVGQTRKTRNRAQGRKSPETFSVSTIGYYTNLKNWPSKTFSNCAAALYQFQCSKRALIQKDCKFG